MSYRVDKPNFLESWFKMAKMTLKVKVNDPYFQLEQLKRLRSEDTPRCHVITHTSDQFVLNPKSILSTSSYRIPSQNKVKAEKIRTRASSEEATYARGLVLLK